MARKKSKINSSRTIKIVLIVLAVLIVAAAATAGGAYYYIQVLRPNQALVRAEAAFAAKDWKTAKIEYSTWLSKYPRDVDALLRYADCNLNTVGNRPRALLEAAKAYRQILTATDEQDKVMLEKIFDLYRKVEYWADLEYISDLVLRTAPDDLDAQYYKAYAIHMQDRRSEATEQYMALVEKGVDRPELYGNLARVLTIQSRADQAEKVLADALSKYPDSADLYVEICKYYDEVGNAMESDKALARATELDSENVDVLILNGMNALSEQLVDQADTIAKRVLELAPTRGEGYGLTASVLQRKGDTEGALKVVTDMDPLVRVDYPNLIVSQIELLINLEKYDEALVATKDYVGAFPNQTPMRDYFEGRIALARNQFSEAITKLLLARGDLPSFPNIQYFLGLAYLRDNQRDKAKLTFDAYLRQNPNDQKARIMVMKEFPDDTSGGDATAVLQDIMQTEGSDPDIIVSTALAMFDGAYRKGTPAVVSEEVLRMLGEALRREPKSLSAYRAIADVNTALGRFPEADKAIADGIAAGIPESDFRITRASILLAQKNVDGAKAEMDVALSAPELTLGDVKGWMRLFEARRQPVLAQSALDVGINRLSGEDAVECSVEQMALATRRNDTGTALALSKDIEPKIGGIPMLKDRFDKTMIDIAERLLLTNDPKNIELAGPIISKAAESDKDNLRLKTLRAEMLLRSTPPDKSGASTLFSEVLGLEPTNVGALMGAANLARSTGEFERALQLALDAANSAPDLASAKILCAEIYIDLTRMTEAQSMLKGVLDKDPGDLRAARLMITTFVQEGDVERVPPFLEKVADAVKGDPIALNTVNEWRGTLMSLSSSPDSEQTLRDQYAKNPDSVAHVRNLAMALSRNQKFDEAEQVLKDYIAKHDDAEAWASLGTLYISKRGDDETYRKASTALTRALLRNPENTYAIREMVRLNSLEGNGSEALAYCDRYLKLNPGDIDMLFRKASLLARERQFPAALDAINAALAAGQQVEYLALRGFIYLDMGRFDEAVADLKLSIKDVNNPSAQVEMGLAEAFAASGDMEQAKMYYEAAQGKAKQGQSVDQVRALRVREMLRAKGVEV